MRAERFSGYEALRLVDLPKPAVTDEKVLVRITAAAISSTTNHAKAEQAKALGFDEVIDTSLEKLGDGVRRITDGYGADIVIDGIDGEVLSEALKALALGRSLTTRGYSATRKTTIDVTDLIVPHASIRSLNMFVSRRRPLLTIGRPLSLYFNPARSNRSWRRRSLWHKRLRLCVISLKTSTLREGSSYNLTTIDRGKT